MRIALFSDIHGHVTGLRAVLARLKWLGGADAVYCLGDILGGGPGLDDVVDLLLEYTGQEQTDGKLSVQQYQVPFDMSEHERLAKARQMPDNRSIWYWKDE